MTRRLRTITPLLAGLATVVLTGSTALAAVSPAQDPVAVGPGQYFTATINGTSADPVIKVVCLGPIVAGETGHPLADQYLEVQLAPTSSTVVGYTGSAADSIDVLFASASSTSVLTLTAYYVPVEIPTTLELPCGGTGTVTFAPAPTSPTARNLTLAVSYGNVAA
ncbi:hypothetical protein KDL01_20570 [Actinospica durhamensis]|uniref:Uncharacterized protein n=1 Tax=Actinospica durhamensis TaxID=1508375 RepID=A0A941EPS7_9ACTN|nr:hypothetical protein [Actinospica durhamensis]MBR7835682.1 hypothetical protein [Actinospica durhamensis]